MKYQKAQAIVWAFYLEIRLFCKLLQIDILQHNYSFPSIQTFKPIKISFVKCNFAS